MSRLPEKIVKKPNIEVIADSDAVACRCLEIFLACVNDTLKTRKLFNFAVPGGTSPVRFFKLLAKDERSKNLPWDKIHIFWTDERYVPIDSPVSNYRVAAETFLCDISIPKKNIHPITTDLDDIDAAARKYEKTIRSVFDLQAGQYPCFDLIILGMGIDGHIASLLPDSEALLNTSDIACPVYINQNKPPEPPVKRITLTSPVLRSACKLLLLTTGREKAQILKKVISSPLDDSFYPVHCLWLVLDKITWLADTKAAKLL